MLLQRTSFFVRERVGFLKFGDVYDLLDPESQQVVGSAREEPWAPWLRLVVNKRFLPTLVRVLEADGVTIAMTLRKRATILRVRIEVFAADGRRLGALRNKLLSLSGVIEVLDAEERKIGEFSGGVFSWTRELKDASGILLGTMDKKWSGLGKELFTTADNYHLSAAPAVAGKPDAIALLLATCLAYDVAFAES
jgi:hypothetical protein